jgi:hypothetical protein
MREASPRYRTTAWPMSGSQSKEPIIHANAASTISGVVGNLDPASVI